MSTPFPLRTPSSESVWTDLLLDSQTRIETFLTGYMRVPSTWNLEARRLDEHLLYFIQDETALVTTHMLSERLLPGSLMWLSPMVQHSARLADTSKHVKLYHFRFEIFAQGCRWCMPQPVIIRHGVWEQQHLAAQYHDDGQLPGPHRNDRLRSLLYLIYTGLQRAPGNAPEDASGTSLGFSDRRRLEDFTRKQLTSWPTPADLAHVLQLSPDYFTRVFRRTYGIPPRTWLMRERLRAAAARLSDTTHNITEVAREFGYEDLTLFSRQFRQVMGVSPRRYRQHS